MVAPSAAPVRDLIARGLAEHRAGRLDAAEALYRQALAADPRAQEGWRLLAVAMQQRGAFEASLEPAGRALALGRTAVDLSNLCNALNQLGRFTPAAEAGAEALGLDPKMAAAHCNLGVAHRGLGLREAAAQNFAAAAALQPAYADAHANLGVTLIELGRAADAEPPLRAAVRLSPQAPEPRYNLANALLRQLRFAEARELYLEALALRPAYPEAHGNLAAACKALGEPDLALAHYAEAARLAPGDMVLAHNLALMLAELKRYAEAIPVYERVIALDPTQAPAHTNLGSALQELARDRHDASVLALLDRAIFAHLKALSIEPRLFAAQMNLGLALLARGRPVEAVAAFENAIGLQPGSAEAHSNLGQCLSDAGRFAEADAACRQALALNPALAEAHSTLGNTFVAQNRVAEAEPHYRAALALRPEMGGAWCNLGVSLFRQGRTAEAQAAYAEALHYSPELPDAHWNNALALLQRGLYPEGFAEYEWRLRRPGRLRQDAGLTQPLWDGRDLGGAAILVHAEQGYGDAIQCVRFTPQVAARGGRVVLMARAPLKRLFERLPGVAAFVAEGEPTPPVACRTSLFSLPHHVLEGLEALPGPIPYLPVDVAAKAAWAARLAELAPDGLRVGIVWSGNLTSEVEIGRSVPLKRFAPLAAIPGVRLVSLQKGDGLDQLDDPDLGFAVARLGPGYDGGDFAETAAVMAALDLVVSCDTAALHLAGAIGAPVWAAVNRVADWRWMEDREDTPWYPTLRLFRQPVQGDWETPFARMAEALQGSGKRGRLPAR